MLDLSTSIGQITGLVYVSVAILPLWYLASYLISPLGKYPGPLLAGKLARTDVDKCLFKPLIFLSDTSFSLGWTNLWRMYHVRQGKYHLVIQDLHKKYGPVVRIAPNVLDLDIPELVKTIYNTKENYLKVRISYFGG